MKTKNIKNTSFFYLIQNINNYYNNINNKKNNTEMQMQWGLDFSPLQFTNLKEVWVWFLQNWL